MSNAKYAVMAASVATAMTATTAADAAKKCNIVGTFTDSLGSTGQFYTEKKGEVSNTAICSATYTLKVTTLTKTVIDVSGKTKGNVCGALTGDFTFNNGGCDSASGTVTIVGLGAFADTITKTGNGAVVHPHADTSLLTTGLK
jgi:phospholipase/lecithinase/hemolysin